MKQIAHLCERLRPRLVRRRPANPTVEALHPAWHSIQTRSDTGFVLKDKVWQNAANLVPMRIDLAGRGCSPVRSGQKLLAHLRQETHQWRGRSREPVLETARHLRSDQPYDSPSPVFAVQWRW